MQVYFSYRKIWLFAFLTLLLTFNTFAQNKWLTQIIDENGQLLFSKKQDTQKIEALSQHFVQKYYQKGFLAISIDSIYKYKDTICIKIFMGTKYQLGKINIADSLLSLKKPKKLHDLKNFEYALLNKYYSYGYITTQINKTVTINNSYINLIYTPKIGNQFFFDTLHFTPHLISTNYIEKCTGIHLHKPANLNQINQLPQKFERNKILILDSIGTSYTSNKVKLTLYLKKRAQNSFSGILGFQTNNNNQIETTGNIDLNLINTLNQGESFSFNWEKTKALSQQLHVQTEVPYIFKTPLNILAGIHINKVDTSYTHTLLQWGIASQLNTYNKGSLFLNYSQSTVNTATDTSLFSTATTLYYGLGFTRNTFNHFYNPNSGYGINIEFYAGNKKQNISQNQTHTSVSLKATLSVEKVFRVKPGKFWLQNKSGIIVNDSVKRNHTFELGGLDEFRGFNENSIYAKSYTIFTLEYRINLNTSSYAYAFYDGGYTNDSYKNSFTLNTRQALGLGLNLKTAAGIIKISYAIGKTNTSQFNLNHSIIHIGYINKF